MTENAHKKKTFWHALSRDAYRTRPVIYPSKPPTESDEPKTLCFGDHVRARAQIGAPPRAITYPDYKRGIVERQTEQDRIVQWLDRHAAELPLAMTVPKIMDMMPPDIFIPGSGRERILQAIGRALRACGNLTLVRIFLLGQKRTVWTKDRTAFLALDDSARCELLGFPKVQS